MAWPATSKGTRTWQRRARTGPAGRYLQHNTTCWKSTSVKLSHRCHQRASISKAILPQPCGSPWHDTLCTIFHIIHIIRVFCYVFLLCLFQRRSLAPLKITLHFVWLFPYPENFVRIRENFVQRACLFQSPPSFLYMWSEPHVVTCRRAPKCLFCS